MSFIGNVLWFVLGGFLISIYYFLMGLLFCVTIIGIPFGVQLMKIGAFALNPFGHEPVSDTNDGGCLAILMNVLWILFGGIEIALLHVTLGLIFCLTVIGIPFGLQHFKMAILALVPFGKKIV